MIILKEVIHFSDTNSVEATWVDRTVVPDTEVAEVPAVLDGSGNVVTPSVPAYTVPSYVVDVPVKCHSYADVQMGMFRVDVAELGGAIADHEAMIAAVEADIVPYVPPPVTVQAITNAMTELFDSTAQSRHYDNRITCALRAGYPGPFHDEGAAFAAWMDDCNATAYDMLAQVEAGTMAMPESVDSALALLPEMVWP